MEMKTEYDELLEVLACAKAAASISGRNLPQKYRDLIFQAMDLRQHLEPETEDSLVLDELHARTRAICREFSAMFASAIAKGFATHQMKH